LAGFRENRVYNFGHMTHWASFLDQSAYELDKQIKQCKYGMNEYLCELEAVFVRKYS
jgi:hypothetical protein